jgi:hypothetical protein
MVASLGEVNMADADTLVDFITWAVQTYPASKHALILSDHGMGWPGGWSDASGQGSVDRKHPPGSCPGRRNLHDGARPGARAGAFGDRHR